MSKAKFLKLLQQELDRIDGVKTAKRNERVISGFMKDPSPKGIINGKEVLIFNSNDYLGLRFHPELLKAEHEASEEFGTGPGAVRFISGTLLPHKQLEEKLAKFHNRDAAIIFSSAFATNLATLFSLIVGQSKDSVVDNDVLVISDALNHRSIIDGIRIANHPKEAKAIFEHMNPADLEKILKENVGKFKRALVVTDGVFSMLGEIQKLKELKDIIEQYDKKYERGILLVVDDAHGIGALGNHGTGSEEIEGVKADVLIGTLGKGLGSDGGYVVADQVIIDYLRESAATYIYSNSISPGTAAAGSAAIELLSKKQGKDLIDNLKANIVFFKKLVKDNDLKMAADSKHPIQPLLIGSPEKTKALVSFLLEKNILVTSINYPVVAKGADEIRIQLSATHTNEDIKELIDALLEARKSIEF
jgi:glycine C-acetyltransferase